MTNRKLSLKRETLSALTAGDMQAVVGASGASCGGTCYEPRCFIEIAASIKPTCQESICVPCPTF